MIYNNLFVYTLREKLVSPSITPSIVRILQFTLLNIPFIMIETANPQIYALRSRIIIAHYSASELISGQVNSYKPKTKRLKYIRGACI
ncbi:MAG: hypothetical protein PHY48_17370 [Candidatus Cloacimonetes bacterium]|nr:hypothetical protein [Candidatus Cloacimonadota bacterium]